MNIHGYTGYACGKVGSRFRFYGSKASPPSLTVQLPRWKGWVVELRVGNRAPERARGLAFRPHSVSFPESPTPSI